MARTATLSKRAWWLPRVSPRASRFLVLLACGSFAAYFAGSYVLADIRFGFGLDADAYWQAALRLREGSALYSGWSDPTAHDVYRYAPWFAAAWVPLTYLPPALVFPAWIAAMYGATLLLVAPLWKFGNIGIAAALIVGALVASGAGAGNVEPLIALVLARSTPRLAPLAIAAVASLKFPLVVFAILLPLPGMVAAGAIWLVLVAPMLLFDLSDYATIANGIVLPAWLWLPLLVASSIALLLFRRTRYAGALAGVVTLVAVPTIQQHYIGRLLAPNRSPAPRR